MIDQVLQEPTNGYDDLRIIAKDRGGLDRALIEAAADELEMSQRTLVQMYAELVETRQKLSAISDRLTDMRKQSKFPSISASFTMIGTKNG